MDVVHFSQFLNDISYPKFVEFKVRFPNGKIVKKRTRADLFDDVKQKIEALGMEVLNV